MAKILTEDELKEKISLEVGSQTAEIAEGVFKKMYGDAEEKIDGKISKLIYGGIIATIVLFFTIIFSTWLFMSSYQEHYLDTQSAFNKKINDL